MFQTTMHQQARHGKTYTTVILDDSNSVDWPGRRMIEFANGGQWVEGMGLVNGFWGIEYS